jgi:hypothetical protein
MKPGAGDDPFAEDESDDEPDSTGDNAQISKSDPSESEETPTSRELSGGSSEQVTELPYKYRRSSVKEGRTQQPVFLQDDTEALIEATVDEIESQFDETVYKTDVVEAMIVAGGENTTPEAVLRRWGYGMKNS